MAGGRPQLALDRCWRTRNKTKEKEPFPGFAPCGVSFPPCPGSPRSPWHTHPSPATWTLLTALSSHVGAAQAPPWPTTAPNGSSQPRLWQTELSSSFTPCPFPTPWVGTITLWLQQREKGDLWETLSTKMMPCYRCRAWNETVSEVWGAWPSDDDALHYVHVNNPSNAPHCISSLPKPSCGGWWVSPHLLLLCRGFALALACPRKMLKKGDI